MQISGLCKRVAQYLQLPYNECQLSQIRDFALLFGWRGQLSHAICRAQKECDVFHEVPFVMYDTCPLRNAVRGQTSAYIIT